MESGCVSKPSSAREASTHIEIGIALLLLFDGSSKQTEQPFGSCPGMDAIRGEATLAGDHVFSCASADQTDVESCVR